MKPTAFSLYVFERVHVRAFRTVPVTSNLSRVTSQFRKDTFCMADDNIPFLHILRPEQEAECKDDNLLGYNAVQYPTGR